jgi:hypothetical protein
MMEVYIVRINRGTLGSTKRRQVGLDQFGVRLHLSKDPGESGEQGIYAAEEAIVSSVLASMLPQPFRGVQFRRVRWQWMHFQPMPIGLEPCPGLRILVVAGIVLNQNRSLAAVAPQAASVFFRFRFSV